VNEGKAPSFGSELKGAMTLRWYEIIQIDDLTIHLKGKGDGEKDLKMRFASSEVLKKWIEMLRIHLDYRTKIDAIYKTIGGLHSPQTLNGKIV
jgi:site-specific recombinase XerC